jgi:integrase
MIELQQLTGMRSGEVTAMRPVDLYTTGKNWIFAPRRHKTAHYGHARTIYLGPKARAVVEPFLSGRAFEAYLFSPIEAEGERRADVHAERKTPLSCGNRPGSNRREKPAKKLGARYTTVSYLRSIYRACDAAFSPPQHLARHRVAAHRGKDGTRWETDREWRARLGDEKWVELQQWQADHRWHPHQLRHNAGTRLRKQYGLEAARIVLGQRSAAVAEIYAEIDQAKAEQIMAEVG